MHSPDPMYLTFYRDVNRSLTNIYRARQQQMLQRRIKGKGKGTECGKGVSMLERGHRVYLVKHYHDTG